MKTTTAKYWGYKDLVSVQIISIDVCGIGN